MTYHAILSPFPALLPARQRRKLGRQRADILLIADDQLLHLYRGADVAVVRAAVVVVRGRYRADCASPVRYRAALRIMRACSRLSFSTPWPRPRIAHDADLVLEYL